MPEAAQQPKDGAPAGGWTDPFGFLPKTEIAAPPHASGALERFGSLIVGGKDKPKKRSPANCKTGTCAIPKINRPR
jgi:hypothetical protein